MMNLLLLTAMVLGLISPVQQENYREENVTDNQGLNISVHYYQPPFGGAPTIVVVHDWGASLDRWEDVAPRLQSQGFGVLLFNLRGHGDREAPWYLFTDEDVADLRRDVALVVDYAARLSPGAVYLLGEGLGANLALNVAADDRRVSKVVALSPGLVYRGVSLTRSIIEKDAARILLIASRDDTYSANCLQVITASVSPEPPTTYYANAGHGVWMLKRVPDAIAAIAKWLIGKP